jgi:hypothetical protein
VSETLAVAFWKSGFDESLPDVHVVEQRLRVGRRRLGHDVDGASGVVPGGGRRRAGGAASEPWCGHE